MNALARAVATAHRFMIRQKHNYRVAVSRQAMSSFLANLTVQYNSIYITGLGANPVQLGGISSAASGVGALLSLPVGWLVDRYSLRKLYLTGILLTAVASLMYGLASGWKLIIVASIAAVPASQFLGAGCSVICRDSVANRDRLTAQNICVTLASAGGLGAPAVAAALVTTTGGLTSRGIRPLYWIQVTGYLVVFFVVLRRLGEPSYLREPRAARLADFAADFRQLLETGSPLKKWMLVALLTSMPQAMTAPFFQLYAYEHKGATAAILAARPPATILARLVFGIPLGRFADRFGRKRLIYALTPLWYGSFLMLILARGPILLVGAAALQTFFNIASGAAGAMGMEMVPARMAGRWHGVLGILGGVAAIPASLLGGVIYRHWDPVWVFILPIAIDLTLRLPLLARVAETLPGDSRREDGTAADPEDERPQRRNGGGA